MKPFSSDFRTLICKDTLQNETSLFVLWIRVPRAGQPLKSTNQMSWRRILRMKRGFVHQKDGHWPRSARRNVGIRLPDLPIQVPVSHRVKFLLLGRLMLSLLISSFFVGSPFASVDLNLRTSASVADREVIGQNQLPTSAALEEPFHAPQAARPQTDDKYKVALQRLGKDEYNLVNLVTCLNDFDPWNLSRILLMRLIYLVM